MGYNIKKIQSAKLGAMLVKRQCRLCAAMYGSVHNLPISVTDRINSRRKLYNFLEALEFDAENIKAIFWQYDLSVPRDRKLKPVNIKTSRPDWLDNAPIITFEE